MNSDSELLDDVSFDRNFVPKDQEGDLLVSLLRNEAFGEKSAILLEKYPIKPEQLERLIKEDRVVIVSQNPMRIYLTDFGKIVACGELSIRKSEI